MGRTWHHVGMSCLAFGLQELIHICVGGLGAKKMPSEERASERLLFLWAKEARARLGF